MDPVPIPPVQNQMAGWSSSLNLVAMMTQWRIKERKLLRIFPDQNQKKNQNPMPVMTMPTGNQTTGNEYGRGINLEITSHCRRGRREERKRSPDPVGITTPPIGVGLAHLRGHVTDPHVIDDHPIPDLVQDPGKKK